MWKSPTKLVIILATVILFLALADKVSVFSLIREKSENVSVPLVSFLYTSVQKLDFFLSPLTSWWKQASEIARLRVEVQRLATQSARLQILEQENQALRKQLGVKEHFEKEIILAHPIAIERFLVLDRGEADGVSVGDSVIFAELLIGKVVATTPRTSSVILPSDPESEIPVWTTRLTRGVVKGVFGKTIRLDQVLQSDQLSENDLVLTTGESGYLQNLVVAKVRKIEGEPRDVFKTAELESLVDVRKLRVIFITKE